MSQAICWISGFHGASSANDAPRRPGRRPGLAAVAALALAGVLALGSCAGEPAALEVGSVEFTRDEVLGLGDAQLTTLARLTAVGLAVRDRTPERLGRPILEERREQARVDRLRDEVVLELAGIDDSTLREEYDVDPEWELEVRHLVVVSERWRSEESRAEARRRAEAARERALEGEPFSEVAGEVSDEPGARERGGLLEPGREGTWVREFWDAAVALEPGGLSPVVETEYGFHVLKLEDQSPVPFAEARDRVASEVAERVDDSLRWEAWLARHLEARGADGDELDEAALRAILLEEADARDIELPDPVRARIDREWERTVTGWAAVLGFEPGVSDQAIHDQALDALARTGQNVGLARDDVNRHGEALDEAFPVRHPDEG